MAGSPSPAVKPCTRCKTADAPQQLRSEATCRDCYVHYVNNKVIKRMGTVHIETRKSTRPEPRRFAVGLSFGPSSSALVCLMEEQVKFYENKKGALEPFQILAIHVDTDLSRGAGDQDGTLARRLIKDYQGKFPRIKFECVHLSKVLELKTVDWSALPGIGTDKGQSSSERLQHMFDSLPSVTARADVLRLLTRHLLLHISREQSYSALLYGHSATALAALTLSEVANGRGFAVPWQVKDGPFTISTFPSDASDSTPVSRLEYPIYYPLREIFKGEINTYNSLMTPLAELGFGINGIAREATGTIVSHRDTSIEEVMMRYFESAEDSHVSVVSNVVRTTDKLERVRGAASCGLCGVTLDEQGDSRWAGELGDDGVDQGDERRTGSRLCYGCKRSVNG